MGRFRCRTPGVRGLYVRRTTFCCRRGVDGGCEMASVVSTEGTVGFDGTVEECCTLA